LFIVFFIIALGLAGYAYAESSIDETFKETEEWLYQRDLSNQDNQTAPQKPVRSNDSSQPQKPVKDTISNDVSVQDDDHYIQSDDYFISTEPLKNQEWIYVYLAKMITPPTQKTKGEGEFLKVSDGNKVWTKYYYSTRIATQNDLKLGVEVIVLDRQDNGIYRAPENKDEARNSDWFIAKITDLSDLYKGYFTVSGGYKINVRAARIIIKKAK